MREERDPVNDLSEGVDVRRNLRPIASSTFANAKQWQTPEVGDSGDLGDWLVLARLSSGRSLGAFGQLSKWTRSATRSSGLMLIY